MACLFLPQQSFSVPKSNCKRPEMSNANAAVEIFGLLVPSHFFFCLSFMLSVGFQASISLSVAVCPQGLNTSVSLTSITFAGLCVSLSLSASQKHLQHKDHIVSLTIRCLNFERLLLTLPHTERKAAKISTIFKVE